MQIFSLDHAKVKDLAGFELIEKHKIAFEKG